MTWELAAIGAFVATLLVRMIGVAADPAPGRVRSTGRLRHGTGRTRGTRRLGS